MKLTPHMATALLRFSAERRYVPYAALDAVHSSTLRGLKRRGLIEFCGVYVAPYKLRDPLDDADFPRRQSGFWITDAGIEARDNHLRSIES